MIRIVPVDATSKAGDDLLEIRDLGIRIWHAYFPKENIISDDQVTYMLNKYYDRKYLEKSAKFGEIIYKLVDDGASFGFFSYKCDFENHSLHLKKAFIDERWRNKGIFEKKILLHIQDVARTHELTSIKLFVNRKNSQAISAYKACGFTEIESIDVDIGNGFMMHDVLMQKDVNCTHDRRGDAPDCSRCA